MRDSSAKRRRTFGLGHCDGLSAGPLKRPRGAVNRRRRRIDGTGIRRCCGARALRLYSIRTRPMVRGFDLGCREPLMAICDMSAYAGAILRMKGLQDLSTPRRSVFHLIRTWTEAHRWHAVDRTRADGREGPAIRESLAARCLLRNADNAQIRHSRTARSCWRLGAESQTIGNDLGRRSTLCEFIKLGELK